VIPRGPQAPAPTSARPQQRGASQQAYMVPRPGAWAQPSQPQSQGTPYGSYAPPQYPQAEPLRGIDWNTGRDPQLMQRIEADKRARAEYAIANPNPANEQYRRSLYAQGTYRPKNVMPDAVSDYAPGAPEGWRRVPGGDPNSPGAYPPPETYRPYNPGQPIRTQPYPPNPATLSPRERAMQEQKQREQNRRPPPGSTPRPGTAPPVQSMTDAQKQSAQYFADLYHRRGSLTPQEASELGKWLKDRSYVGSGAGQNQFGGTPYNPGDTSGQFGGTPYNPGTPQPSAPGYGGRINSPPASGRKEEWRQSQQYKDWRAAGGRAFQAIGYASDGTQFSTITEADLYDEWLKSQPGTAQPNQPPSPGAPYRPGQPSVGGWPDSQPSVPGRDSQEYSDWKNGRMWDTQYREPGSPEKEAYENRRYEAFLRERGAGVARSPQPQPSQPGLTDRLQQYQQPTYGQPYGQFGGWGQMQDPMQQAYQQAMNAWSMPKQQLMQWGQQQSQMPWGPNYGNTPDSRPSPWSQQITGMFGNNQQDMWGNIGGFIQAANNQSAQKPVGTYMGQGNPGQSYGQMNYNPQFLMQQAQQMMQGGWQNPFMGQMQPTPQWQF
jgi:hypothetical protein